jgi:hypothetical protein
MCRPVPAAVAGAGLSCEIDFQAVDFFQRDFQIAWWSYAGRGKGAGLASASGTARNVAKMRLMEVPGDNTLLANLTPTNGYKDFCPADTAVEIKLA